MVVGRTIRLDYAKQNGLWETFGSFSRVIWVLEVEVQYTVSLFTRREQSSIAVLGILTKTHDKQGSHCKPSSELACFSRKVRT
jgi:hypothetical protein